MVKPKAWIIEQALREYLGHEKHFIEAITQGIEEADQGKLILHSQAMKDIYSSYLFNSVLVV